MTPGLAAFKLAFQISPIFLTGGIAGSLVGGTLPIVALLQGGVFADLLSGGSDDIDLDDFFAHFMPAAGASLINQKFGTYPFANLATAANAQIADGINISLIMRCPAKLPGDYIFKQPVLTALRATLAAHNNSGGTYSVNTPAMLYTDCLLARLVDATPGESKQVQYTWQWDFYKPLITQADALNAQNNLMGKLSNQTQLTPNASGVVSIDSIDITGSPASGAAPSAVPSTQPNQGLGFGSDNVPNIFGSSGPGSAAQSDFATQP